MACEDPLLPLGDLHTLHRPAETLLSGIGTLAFYMLLVVTVTSYLRLSFGLKLWKQLHYVAYALLPAALAHGLLVNSSLDKAVPIDYIDAGKLIVEACAAVTIALVVWRLAYRRRSREMDSPRPVTAGEGKIVTVGADRPPWAGQLTLSNVFQETWNVKTFRFVADADEPLPSPSPRDNIFRSQGSGTTPSPPHRRSATTSR